MIFTKKQCLGAATMGAVVIASTFAILRMKSGVQWAPPPEYARIAEETERSFREASYARADDIGPLTEAFTFVPVYSVRSSQPSELDTSSRASFAETISGWLVARASGDADVYAAWMRSRGYTPAPFVANDRRLFGRRFQLRVGREITPDDTPWDVFKAAFEHEMSGAREPGPTTAISTGPQAIEVQTVRIDRVDALTREDPFTPLLVELVESSELPEDLTKIRWEDGLGRLHWYFGVASSAGALHWAPPISLAEVIDRDGSALIARALFMQRTSKKRMIPTIMTMYHDPMSGDWHFNSITYTFLTMDAITGGPEY